MNLIINKYYYSIIFYVIYVTNNQKFLYYKFKTSLLLLFTKIPC